MHFADPLSNVLQMGLREGVSVADLGSGSGHYAVAAANVVGESGRVYAVDVQEDVLRRLSSEAKERELSLETIHADIEKLPFKDASMDAAILSNVLFQIPKKEDVLKEAKRILKSKGKLLVIDWAGGYSGMGPANDAVVAEADAERLLIAAGFHKAKAFRGGPHHYALLFTAP